MGSVGSKAGGAKSEENGGVAEVQGSQLYVSLKMQVELSSCKRLGDVIPHVYGSAHMVGSWDPSKAVSPLALASSLHVMRFRTVATRYLIELN